MTEEELQVGPIVHSWMQNMVAGRGTCIGWDSVSDRSGMHSPVSIFTKGR